MIAATNMAGGQREALCQELRHLQTKRSQLRTAMLENAQDGKHSGERRKHRYHDDFDQLVKRFDDTQSQIKKIERRLSQNK